MNENKPVRPIRRDELRKFRNIVVVFGGRNFTDEELFGDCVVGFINDHNLKVEDTVFVSGMAKGPDMFIVNWSKSNGWRWHECPAAWEDIEVPGARIKQGPKGPYNSLAGFVRNQEMANVSTHGLGFWDGKSRGTGDMVDRCNKKKLKMRIIRVQG